MNTRLCLLSLVLLTPCLAAEPPLDFSSYERVPDGANSLVLRAVLKTIPYTKERAFHGCYGGFGNKGGHPVDTVDSLCRKHDIIYASAKSVASLRLADRVLVTELSKLDPNHLTPEACTFRRRAMAFMSGKCARFFGKPPGTWFRGSEPQTHRPIDEQKLTKFFRAPVGPGETLLLVSMVRKDPAAPQTSDQHWAARPITRQQKAAPVAQFSSASRGKL